MQDSWTKDAKKCPESKEAGSRLEGVGYEEARGCSRKGQSREYLRAPSNVSQMHTIKAAPQPTNCHANHLVHSIESHPAIPHRTPSRNQLRRVLLLACQLTNLSAHPPPP